MESVGAAAAINQPSTTSMVRLQVAGTAGLV